MDKMTKNLKRRIENGIERIDTGEVYLTEQRNEANTKIANVYYCFGYQGLRVKFKKYVAKRNDYVQTAERCFDVSNLEGALEYIAKFVAK